MIVAIDGPAASGKTITAKLLAEKLNFIHLNSGLMYRALTYLTLNNKMTLECLIKEDIFNHSKIYFKGKNLENVFFNGNDITSKLFKQDINDNIKEVSNDSQIRQKLIKFQRFIVKDKNVVCEGRDIGSVVFPSAEFKFFLVASIDTRINRRFIQLSSKSNVTKSEIRNSIVERDNNDKNRKISPLIKVNDSIEIDTTLLTIKDQVDHLYNIILNKEKNDK